MPELPPSTDAALAAMWRRLYAQIQDMIQSEVIRIFGQSYRGGLVAPSALPTVYGSELTATDFKATGLTGATAASRYVGATASGAPASGTFAAGDFTIDQTGKVWVCTAAGSPGTWTGASGGMTDPQTTIGDMIYRNGSNVTARLPIGSTGQILSVSGGLPAWGAAPSGPGGGLTLLGSTVLGTTATSISLSSISGAYTHLQVVFYGRGDTSATLVELKLTLNGDTAANYDWQELYTSGAGSPPIQGSAAGAAYIRLGYASAATAPASAAGGTVLWIPVYAGTTFKKSVRADSELQTGTAVGTLFVENYAGFWRSTAAITQVTITAAAGNFIAGSTMSVYGMS